MEADESRVAHGRGLGDLSMGPPTHNRRCNFDEDDIEWGHYEEPGGAADTGAPGMKVLRKGGKADWRL